MQMTMMILPSSKSIGSSRRVMMYQLLLEVQVLGRIKKLTLRFVVVAVVAVVVVMKTRISNNNDFDRQF